MAKESELRKKIEDHFLQNRIAMTGYVYKIPLSKQPRIIYSKNFIERDLPNTNHFCNSHFTPPNYPELSDQDIKYISDVLNNFNPE